ncbi:MAG: hypothetical protein CM1200mP10_01110 [Candidatus Neomarinimicrobiota bacterium]|nr:MAG: hypothetical protein CM1200mP10_01110 [Candidatus Neomarinimicrobiota bacterium]
MFLKKVENIELLDPFPRMTFSDAMSNYGTDCPDLRYNMKLQDMKPFSDKSDFNSFKSAKLWWESSYRMVRNIPVKLLMISLIL